RDALGVRRSDAPAGSQCRRRKQLPRQGMRTRRPRPGGRWPVSARLDASPDVNDATELAFRLEDELVPMGVFDAETLRIVAVNEAAVRAYGYSPAEFSRMASA